MFEVATLLVFTILNTPNVKANLSSSGPAQSQPGLGNPGGISRIVGNVSFRGDRKTLLVCIATD
jgi:hypothetical protein